MTRLHGLASMHPRIEHLRGRATGSPALALFPLRLFLGATFLYAGLDKLLSPTFFVVGSPGSIHQQLAAFARHSPIGGVIALTAPWAIEVGLGIAIAEIAVGIGALSGFGFRLAAVGGALLAGLFWLTASWATHPYYYGPDLPYAAGWLTLALAGHGELFVLARRPPAAGAGAAPAPAIDSSPDAGPRGIARRTVLEAGMLGTVAVLVASASVPLRMLIGGGVGDFVAATPTPSPSPIPEPTISPSPSRVPTELPGIAVASIADTRSTGSVAFTVPFTAPPPLPAGDPGVIVRLGDGSYAAFDAICTHAGCTVEWDDAVHLLVCPCHGATFDPADGGRVVEGPTDLPLTILPLMFDPSSGTFLLRTGGV